MKSIWIKQSRLVTGAGMGISIWATSVIMLVTQFATLADVIPLDRITSWQGNVGVEGGIPARTTIFRTLTTANTLADINNALASCPSNQVVLLAAGTYILNGQIIINGRSGVTLRGSGPASTILHFIGAPPWGNIFINGAAIYNAIIDGNFLGTANWIAGYTQGGSNLTFSSVANLAVGRILCLDQLNDGTDVDAIGWEGACTYCGRAGGNRSQEQYSKVRAINGNTVTIWPPLYMPNWRSSQAPLAWWTSGYTEMSGIEDLKVEGAESSPGNPYSANIALSGVWNCWVKNVESDDAKVCHVNVYGGGRCEVRHCYFLRTQTAATTSYGFFPIFASACLFEDNIVNRVTAPFVFGACVSGTVTAYNYCTNDYYPVSPNYLSQAFVTHDAHVCMNLFEGNYAPGLSADFYHGSSGYNTFFRNRLTGYEPGKDSFTFAMVLWIKQRYYSAAGNVLGAAGVHNHYESAVGGSQYYGGAIYQAGWGNVNYPIFGDDPATLATFYRHGNYDVVNNAIVWNSTNSDRLIPSSLYLGGRPAWFGDRPWPPYDPSHPAGGVVTNIPAGYRFVFGVDPSQPPLLLLPVAVANGWSLSFNGAAGTAYQVQRAVAVTGPWTNRAAVTTDSSGRGAWVDTNALPKQAFYRIMVP